MKWVELDWEKYDKDIVMICYRELTDKLKLSLINILLNRNCNDFFSLTTYTDETTIFVDKETSDKYDIDNSNYASDLYICYQLMNTGSFVEESGLVNMISSKLKDNGIPILYLTTSNSNFLLLPTLKI